MISVEVILSGLATNNKTLGCLCFQSDPITATINTDKTGYVSGEMVQFNIEVENLSNRDMDGMFLVLKKSVTYNGWYMGETGDKTEEREVERLDREENIRPRSTDHWRGTVKLPDLPPTGLGGSCKIIDLQYSLELHVDPAGPSFDLVVNLPIMVGTVPVKESQRDE